MFSTVSSYYKINNNNTVVWEIYNIIIKIIRCVIFSRLAVSIKNYPQNFDYTE